MIPPPFHLGTVLLVTVGAEPGLQAGPCWPTHQGRHGKANDLEVAIVVPLGLKVVVLPRVAPGHGACAVPEGKATQGPSEDSRAGWRHQGTHRALPSSPGDIQENNALGFQVLNLGGQVSSITLQAGTGEGVGYIPVPRQPPLGPPTLPASLAHLPPLGCAWPSP